MVKHRMSEGMVKFEFDESTLREVEHMKPEKETGVFHSKLGIGAATVYDYRTLQERMDEKKPYYGINWTANGVVGVPHARAFAEAILAACDWVEEKQ